jgi:uncharacterized membrane protein
VDWGVFVVQWLHVILGVFWFGNSLALDFLIIPALNKLPMVTQRQVGSEIGKRSSPIFRVIVPILVLLGIIRGTVYGPIKGLDDLRTAYGLTWLTALILTVGVYVWGLRVLEPALKEMTELPLNADGSVTPAIETATNRVKRLVGLELFGFLAIFTCMILMRVGI